MFADVVFIIVSGYVRFNVTYFLHSHLLEWLQTLGNSIVFGDKPGQSTEDIFFIIKPNTAVFIVEVECTV